MMPPEIEKKGPSEQDVGPPDAQSQPDHAEGADGRGTRFADAFRQINAFSHRVADRAQGLARRVTTNVRLWIILSATTVSTVGRTTTRRAYDQIVLFPLRARFHFHRRRRVYVLVSVSLVLLLTLFACWGGMKIWPIATHYCARLSPSTFEQVAVYLGASISGLLAIVFALTTFAIQQVAAREAAEIVLEYANDRRMASTYWILAAFASVCFVLPFVHLPQDFLPTEMVLFSLLLLLAFLLIYRHFKIVMLYSDPRFTVDRLYRRGMRELRTAARTVERLKRTTRPAGEPHGHQ